MLKKIIACATASICLLGNAGGAGICTALACENVFIEELYVNADGPVYLQISGDISSLNCSPESGVFLTLNMSKPQSQALYSLLLTAYSQQKTVRIRMMDYSQGCDVVYAIVNR